MDYKRIKQIKIMEKDKVRMFLNSLNDLDYRYLRLQCQMANDARHIVNEFLITKEQFCERMKLDVSEYDSYMNGGYEYTVMHMAMIQAYYIELSMEKSKLEANERFTGVKTP